jgi:hypothetical protein
LNNLTASIETYVMFVKLFAYETLWTMMAREAREREGDWERKQGSICQSNEKGNM